MAKAPTPKPDTEGVHEIANTANAERVADIVFVHGLGGNSHGTWTNDNGFFWPHVLGREVKNCAIWSVGYPAGTTKIGQPGMVIGKRAQSLANALVSHGIGCHRPVLFIAHSMGGLVVKAIIDECRHHVNPELELLVQKIKGIAFCGTPHQGSDFAKIADRLGRYLDLPSDHLREMASHAEGLELLHGRFMGWLRTHPIGLRCFAENGGLKKSGYIIGEIVPSWSALMPDVINRTFDADHIGLVKPDSFDSPIYKSVLKFILLTLPDAIVTARRIP